MSPSRPEPPKSTDESRIAVCGIVRDCARNLRRNLERVESLRGSFRELRIVIAENDSKDGTKAVLRDLQRRDESAIVEIADHGTVTLPRRLASGVNPSFSHHRISKMAAYRNRYLELASTHIGFSRLDWVVMLDWDVEWFRPEGILRTLAKSAAWDVATANGRCKTGWRGDIYYDCYAFRALGAEGPCTETSIRSVPGTMPAMQPGGALIPVESAFNGLAVYRAAALEGVRYRSLPNDDPRVEAWCEHVTFHRDLARRGYDRVVIDPDLEVVYNTRADAVRMAAKRLARRLVPAR